MLFHLLKKDFLILKKSILVMLAVSVALPPVMMWRLTGDLPPEYVGGFALMFIPFFATIVLLQYLNAKEAQYKNAAALLAASSCSRSLLVISQYIFCLAVYFACSVIVGLELLAFCNLIGVYFVLVAVFFLILAVVMGLFMPFMYKFGYERVGIVFSFVIIASPIIWSGLAEGKHFDFDSIIFGAPDWALGLSALAAGVVILFASARVSIGIYNRKDLA